MTSQRIIASDASGSTGNDYDQSAHPLETPVQSRARTDRQSGQSRSGSRGAESWDLKPLDAPGRASSKRRGLWRHYRPQDHTDPVAVRPATAGSMGRVGHEPVAGHTPTG